MRPPLTVIVPCFNNQTYIEECLRSVTWADEILLVDSFSTDKTVAVAQPFVNRVLQHEYENSARQKNWAIPQAAHDWVMIVDTDEVVTDELRREVEDALSRDSGFVGFRIARKNIVFGRWLRHGGYWPDNQTRLFRKDRGRYQDRQVHAHVILDGPLGTLTAPYLHYPHRTIASTRRTFARYSQWEAMQKRQDGTVFHWRQIVIRPLGAFVTRNFVWGGFRDGWRGWLLAALWAEYVFGTYSTLRRLEGVTAKNIAATSGDARE